MARLVKASPAWRPRELRAVLVAAASLTLLLCPAVRGAPPATDPLAEQVQRLTRQVQALEARVRALEAQRRAQQSPAPYSSKAPGAAHDGREDAVPTAGEARQPGGDAPVAVAPAAAEPSTAGADVREHWREIRSGMSMDQVRATLGNPSHKLLIDGKQVWRYSYPNVGSGSVLFDSGGHAAGWQQPPRGWW